MELRTRILNFKERKDGYTEITMIVDRQREKEVFKKLVDNYKDDKINVFKLMEDD